MGLDILKQLRWELFQGRPAVTTDPSRLSQNDSGPAIDLMPTVVAVAHERTKLMMLEGSEPGVTPILRIGLHMVIADLR